MKVKQGRKYKEAEYAFRDAQISVAPTLAQLQVAFERISKKITALRALERAGLEVERLIIQALKERKEIERLGAAALHRVRSNGVDISTDISAMARYNRKKEQRIKREKERERASELKNGSFDPFAAYGGVKINGKKSGYKKRNGAIYKPVNKTTYVAPELPEKLDTEKIREKLFNL